MIKTTDTLIAALALAAAGLGQGSAPDHLADARACWKAGRPLSAVASAEQAAVDGLVRQFDASLLIAGIAADLGDDRRLFSELERLQPGSERDALALWHLARLTCLDPLARRRGPDVALNFLVAVEDRATPALVDATPKTRALVLSDLAFERGELLARSGRTEDARKILGRAIEALNEAGGLEVEQLKGLDERLALLGEPALALQATHRIDNDGTVVELSSRPFDGLDLLRGKVAVLDFEAHFCGPCREALPHMCELHATLRERGVEFVSLHKPWGFYGSQKCEPKEELDRVGALAKQHPKPWPVLVLDPSAWSTYHVTSLPTVFVMDRRGHLAAVIHGYTAERGLHRLLDTFDRLLAEPGADTHVERRWFRTKKVDAGIPRSGHRK